MKAIFFFVITALIGHIVTAQSIERSVISSLGSSVQAGDLQLDYTVGEAAVLALGNEDLLLTQGFHQGTLETTGLNGLPLDIRYRIYPNPATTEVQLQLEGPELDFQVILYDTSGRPLGAKRRIKAVGHWQSVFDLSQQTPGNYFLVIMDRNGHWLQSHKVMKL